MNNHGTQLLLHGYLYKPELVHRYSQKNPRHKYMDTFRNTYIFVPGYLIKTKHYYMDTHGNVDISTCTWILNETQILVHGNSRKARHNIWTRMEKL